VCASGASLAIEVSSESNKQRCWRDDQRGVPRARRGAEQDVAMTRSKGCPLQPRRPLASPTPPALLVGRLKFGPRPTPGLAGGLANADPDARIDGCSGGGEDGA
jgi:hypothetical protein